MEFHRQRIRSICFLIFVPIIVLFGVADLTKKKGPLWLSPNLDPSYVYLLNSLLIISGRPPAHIDHPGTPVQSLGAGILRFHHPGSNEKLVEHALKEPEACLEEISQVLRGLIVIAIFIAGILVAWRLNNVVAGIACQAAPFLFIDVWMAGIRVTPEALFPPIATLYFAALMIAGERKLSDCPSWPWTLLAGLLAGLGVATKLTFLPLLAFLPAIALRWRDGFASAAGFVLALAASLIPIRQRLSTLWSWTTGLATHSGKHGYGEAGIINPQTYGANFVTTLTEATLLAPVIALSIGVAVYTLRSFPKESLERRRAWMLLSIVLCQILGVAFVAKHPGRVYLTPVLFSAALNAWHIWVIVFKTGKWLRTAGAVITTILIACAAWEFAIADRVLGERTNAELADAKRIIDEAKGRPIIRYYSSSSVEYALQFANEYSVKRFRPGLEATYPGSTCWDFFAGGFETIGNAASSPPDLAKGPVYLTGTQPLENYKTKRELLVPAGTRLVPLWSSRYDEPHRLMAQRPTYFYRLESTGEAPSNPEPR